MVKQLRESKDYIGNGCKWWCVPDGTILYHIVSSKYLRGILEQRRLLLTSLAHWNSRENIEANQLNCHYVRFDSEKKQFELLSLESLIHQCYAICFTRNHETKKMWNEYGKGDGLDIGVRIGFDSEKLRDAVRDFWTSHRCLSAQSDNGMAHDDETLEEVAEKIDACLSKFVLLDHVSYKTIKRLAKERRKGGSPYKVVRKSLRKITLDKMMSKRFEDETRLIIEFGCNLMQDFLPLQIDADLSAIKSYTINPYASVAQRERVEGLLWELREIGKLRPSELLK